MRKPKIRKPKTKTRSAPPSPHLLVPALLRWFAASARDLPWRRTRDPYAIWVSEIMLQQTQVKTVIPYWERWMRELPTIESLAGANAEKIHKLWEGLGYYTRVRNMQKAAQQIVRWEKQKVESRKQKGEAGQRLEHRTSNVKHRTLNESNPAARNSCAFPDNFDAILALPGIGRYTAGAIASIAFNQPAPILDGNVIRVLCRLHGIGADPLEKQTNARLWQLAEQLVRGAGQLNSRTRTRPGDEDDYRCSHLNQSLMELGALICTPRSPNCAACPVAAHCTALRDQRVEELPRPKQRAAVTARRFVVFVLERNGKFLVQQRDGNVVNAHLWEFPNVEGSAAEGRARQSVRAALLAWANGAQGAGAPHPADDFQLESPKPFYIVKHSITRYRMTAEAYRITLKAVTPRLPGIWRTLAQLRELPFTSAHRQIAAKLAIP